MLNRVECSCSKVLSSDLKVVLILHTATYFTFPFPLGNNSSIHCEWVSKLLTNVSRSSPPQKSKYDCSLLKLSYKDQITLLGQLEEIRRQKSSRRSSSSSRRRGMFHFSRVCLINFQKKKIIIFFA